MDSIPLKRCSTCGVEKPLAEFHRSNYHKGGYKAACKECRRIEVKATDATKLNPDDLKTCRRCGQTKPAREFDVNVRVSSGYYSTCQECRRATARDWKARNKDRIREYEGTNRGRLRELRYDWQRKNPDRIKEIRRRSYLRHKEYYRKRHVRWYAINRKRSIERTLRYYQTPEGRLRNRNNASRHRAIERKGDVTAEQLSELFARQKRCAYCKKPFIKTRPATIDHVIPLSRGGEHTISNLVLACKPCNCSKHNNLLYLL
jgi:5-methylcytosine-specific restriction endonuclease McrA